MLCALYSDPIFNYIPVIQYLWNMSMQKQAVSHNTVITFKFKKDIFAVKVVSTRLIIIKNTDKTNVLILVFIIIYWQNIWYQLKQNISIPLKSITNQQQRESIINRWVLHQRWEAMWHAVVGQTGYGLKYGSSLWE